MISEAVKEYREEKAKLETKHLAIYLKNGEMLQFTLLSFSSFGDELYFDYISNENSTTRKARFNFSNIAGYSYN